jgi:hypothetical protein
LLFLDLIILFQLFARLQPNNATLCRKSVQDIMTFIKVAGGNYQQSVKFQARSLSGKPSPWLADVSASCQAALGKQSGQQTG